LNKIYKKKINIILSIFVNTNLFLVLIKIKNEIRVKKIILRLIANVPKIYETGKEATNKEGSKVIMICLNIKLDIFFQFKCTILKEIFSEI